VTCFDRRWEEKNDVQANVFDNIIWKLDQGRQAQLIQTPYDLINLVITETSGFFFTCSDDLDKSLQFHEFFRKANCAVVRIWRLSPFHMSLTEYVE
jgi:putative component of membrane protein insertase Oxa1/YidC/SpoIIIJ protein YidD